MHWVRTSRRVGKDGRRRTEASNRSFLLEEQLAVVRRGLDLAAGLELASGTFGRQATRRAVNVFGESLYCAKHLGQGSAAFENQMRFGW